MGALVLVGSVLVSAAPASAVPSVFANPDATPASNDLDITALGVDYTADALVVSAAIENFSSNDPYSFSAYVLPSQRPTSQEPNYLHFTVVKGPDGVTTTYLQATNNGTTGPQAVAIEATVVTTGSSVTLSYPLHGQATNTTFFVWGDLTNGAGPAVTAGIKSIGGQYVGFGPINVTTVATTTTFRLNSPTQVYGSTPAVGFVDLLSRNARGTLSIMEGSTVVTSFEYAGVEIPLNLPTKLAYGAHKLTAVFTPRDPQLYAASSSEILPFAVLSPGTKTSTKLTLSKSTQHYKKKSAKITVKVSHKPAGKVVLYDGTKKLKTLTLKKGTVSYTVSAKLAKGTHKLHAVFVPKKPLSYAPSTSKTKTLKVVR